MSKHVKDIGERHWIGNPYESNDWRRYTLFHIERNDVGGSTSWPIAEIDIVDHPSKDGVNAHTEIKISLRNDIRRTRTGIEVDGNKSKLRQVKEIVDREILDESVAALKALGKVSLPLSVWICVRHVVGFHVEGDFWTDD